MFISNAYEKLSEKIAVAADLCLKPWKHSVIISIDNDDENSLLEDLVLVIQARNSEGLRSSDNDLEVEIYKSGSDLSITLSKSSLPECPILWHGTYSLWMSSETGKICEPPLDSSRYESFVRRLRCLFVDD